MNLQLRVNSVVDGTLAGLHRSRHFGASIEFAEHKVYAPGDDVRQLDWKAFAKFDRYYVRRNEDETELNAYLVCDCSGSMGYGEPLSKLDLATVLAGTLAYLLTRQRDRVGLLAYAGALRCHVPARAGGQHSRSLLRQLEQLDAEGPTDLGVAVKRLLDEGPGRGLVIVFSDLLSEECPALSLLRQLRVRHQQVVLFHLLHTDELTWPFDRVTLFESLEGDERILIDPVAIRATYLQQIRRFVEDTRRACREAGVYYELVSNESPLDRILIDFLKRGPR